jgi:hypothetical protein
VLGAVALATGDAQRRIEALRQGEAILQDGCASHNHFRFYRDALEVSLRENLGDRVTTYADMLEGYFGEEGSPWSDFIVARSRALAAAAVQTPDETLVAELKRLRDYAAEVGMRTMVSRLDQALQDV